jgi:hypothetical protein
MSMLIFNFIFHTDANVYSITIKYAAATNFCVLALFWHAVKLYTLLILRGRFLQAYINKTGRPIRVVFCN